jgi:hypothetical protein
MVGNRLQDAVYFLLDLARAMRKSLLILAAAGVFAHSSLGQIGGTKGELARRYGPPSPYDTRISTLVWWKEYHEVLDEVHPFHTNNFNIVVYFKHGKAVLFRYRKKDRSPMTNDELSSILNLGVKKPRWVPVPGDDKSDLRWRTSDSSVFAYYLPRTAG